MEKREGEKEKKKKTPTKKTPSERGGGGESLKSIPKPDRRFNHIKLKSAAARQGKTAAGRAQAAPRPGPAARSYLRAPQ